MKAGAGGSLSKMFSDIPTRLLAALLMPLMLTSCASHVSRLKQLPRPLIVTVQGAKPHWFFGGNGPLTWAEITFAIEQDEPSTIQVVSILDWTDNFDYETDAVINPQVYESACPRLEVDGARYRIETSYVEGLEKDVPGVHLILSSCTRLDP
jgi:hypothetical protein